MQILVLRSEHAGHDLTFGKREDDVVKIRLFEDGDEQRSPSSPLRAGIIS